MMVFGGNAAQVKYRARHRLRLARLWYRRGPWSPAHARSIYLRTGFTPVLRCVERIANFVHWCARGRLGRVNGWLGVLEKL